MIVIVGKNLTGRLTLDSKLTCDIQYRLHPHARVISYFLNTYLVKGVNVKSYNLSLICLFAMLPMFTFNPTLSQLIHLFFLLLLLLLELK